MPRPREELVLVASVRAADLNLSENTIRGPPAQGLLRVGRARRRLLARAMDSITGEAVLTFDQEMAATLIRRGLHPILQVGCGGFRIDLAFKHPDRPGEFCLGVECDGATNHSLTTARERPDPADRL